jgi:precorrin-6B methylase 2
MKIMNPAVLRNSVAALALLSLAGAVPAEEAWAQSDNPKLDVIYVPTPHDVVKRMLELAKVGPDDIHYDLGSGDGRIAIAAVKDFKAKKAVGIDLDPQRIKESLDNHAKAGVGDRVTFLNRNIFETDFSEANVISLYLLSTLNLKLRPIILNMRPGTRIVTQSFTMADWYPDHKEEVQFNENGFNGSRTVYLFIVPAKVDGKWEMADGERKLALELKQQFQNFSGTATINGKTGEIKGGKLDGATIEFTVEIDGKPVKYEGKVDGNTIAGSGTATWSAKKSS